MFAGVIFFSLTIGSLSSIINDIDLKSGEYEKKLNTLIQIKNEFQIDEPLFLAIQRGIKFSVYKNAGGNFKEFLDDLPEKIRLELSYEMHKDMLINLKFFEDKPENFVAEIGLVIRKVKFMAGETIFSVNEIANEMYFIQNGRVNIVLDEYNNFPFISINRGHYFGDIDVIFQQTRKLTIMAETEVDL